MNDATKRTALLVGGACLLASCGGSPASTSTSTSGTGGGTPTSGTGGSAATGATTTSSTGGGTGGSAGGGGYPVGWLYTTGPTIYVSDGKSGGKPWMGRGVNMD